MEAELNKKMNEIKEQHNGTIGLLLVDKLGLPIESQGNFDKQQSGLISSIMKNAARLEKILLSENNEEGFAQPQSSKDAQQSDLTAKIYFQEENLVIRHKQGLTLALRQKSQ